MLTDVADALRVRARDDHAEQPVAPRERADRRPLLLGHAVRDELDELLTTGPEHPERAVRRVDELARDDDDAVEHLGQVEVGADGEDGVEQRAEPLLRSRGRLSALALSSSMRSSSSSEDSGQRCPVSEASPPVGAPVGDADPVTSRSYSLTSRVRRGSTDATPYAVRPPHESRLRTSRTGLPALSGGCAPAWTEGARHLGRPRKERTTMKALVYHGPGRRPGRRSRTRRSPMTPTRSCGSTRSPSAAPTCTSSRATSRP